MQPLIKRKIVLFLLSAYIRYVRCVRTIYSYAFGLHMYLGMSDGRIILVY